MWRATCHFPLYKAQPLSIDFQAFIIYITCNIMETFSTTRTKTWAKALNTNHIYNVFERHGFTTVGSLKEMCDEASTIDVQHSRLRALRNIYTPGIFAHEIAHLKCDKFFLNRAIILGAW